MCSGVVVGHDHGASLSAASERGFGDHCLIFRIALKKSVRVCVLMFEMQAVKLAWRQETRSSQGHATGVADIASWQCLSKPHNM